jgi:putative addiction module component (TIGR02574 family)
MNSRAIEKEALELPVEKRAKLAQRLLESLENLSEAEADKLWLHEAARRASEIDEGKVHLVKSEELERRIRARIK